MAFVDRKLATKSASKKMPSHCDFIAPLRPLIDREPLLANGPKRGSEKVSARRWHFPLPSLYVRWLRLAGIGTAN